MRWVWKYLFRLLVLAAIVFVGWAYFAELPPPSERITLDIEPPVQAPGAGNGDGDGDAGDAGGGTE